MGQRNRYSPEVKERAVRLVLEHEREHGSQWAAIRSIASKVGCSAESLRNWVRQAERDAGRRPGLTTIRATSVAQFPRARHFIGMPPELSDEPGARRLMPWPRVLVIEEKPGGLFLYRYTEDGQFAGDTWHQSLEDAFHQAESEFGPLLGEWREPPAGEDAIAFALRS